MTADRVVEQVLHTWQVHNGINLSLLQAIPEPGLDAVPLGSKGRSVARQFAHMNRVRLGWLHCQTTGERPRLSSESKTRPPSRAQLRKRLEDSGKAVEWFLWGE